MYLILHVFAFSYYSTAYVKNTMGLFAEAGIIITLKYSVQARITYIILKTNVNLF